MVYKAHIDGKPQRGHFEGCIVVKLRVIEKRIKAQDSPFVHSLSSAFDLPLFELRHADFGFG